MVNAGVVLRRCLPALASVVLAVSGANAQSSPPSLALAGPIVRTDEGLVRGLRSGGLYRFDGIPYAAPPVGQLRWRPPKAPVPWTGVREAKQFGSTCPQVSELGVFAGPPSTTEDCLYLNVVTPDLHPKGRGLPVIVWLHGGGNFDGESNDYDGSWLAAGGTGGAATVVVTINYRLGLLGFLAHPALDDEGHLFGNYGLMDQQAALRWVQRNAHVFGGDAHRVTLAGQSAGAMDTGLNMISPMAKGLFSRAILQSGPALQYTPTFPLPLALRAGEGFAKAANCAGAAAAACLRALPVEEVVRLSGATSAPGPYLTGPILDGSVIPMSAYAAWSSGRFAHIPVMAGTVRDEHSFAAGIQEYFSGPPRRPLTEAQYLKYVTSVYSGPAYPGGPAYPSGTVDRILALYPVGADPQAEFDRVGSDPPACSARKVMRMWAALGIPVYAYEFNDRSAPFYLPPMPGYEPRAAHTIDIQFLFPGFHGGPLGVTGASQAGSLTKQEKRLSDQMVAAWTNFAARGDPNGGPAGVFWPRFRPGSRPGLYLSQEAPQAIAFSEAEFAARHNCALWDAIQVAQP